jgi:Prenyltransferase and squalene oxidase repeat
MRQFLTLSLIVLVPALALSQAPADRAATVKYLLGAEAATGGFYGSPPAPGSQPVPSLSSTSSGLRALRYFGGHPTVPEKHAEFVAKCYDATSGGFRDRPGEKPTVVTTAIGVMAAAELKMPLEPYREGVERYLAGNAKEFEEIRMAAAGAEALGTRPAAADGWLKEVAKTRSPDGTFGGGDGAARATGSTVALILRLGGKLDNREQALKVMRAGQRPDGGWGPADKTGSDLSSTYRVMRSFMMLKEPPADTVRLRAFVASCRNKDGGYGVAPGQPSSVSGTYYAGSVFHWLEGH